MPGPAFHDGTFFPGHTYRYSVSAVDRRSHESGRSAEADGDRAERITSMAGEGESR